MSGINVDTAEPAHWAVLVALSDPTSARSVDATLRAAGFIVKPQVHDAKDAVAAIAMSPPDVVVLDTHLSSDTEASHALTALTAERRIPVVYLSSATDRQSLERAADGHASAYLVRPYSERQLVSTVLLAIITAKRSSSAAAPGLLTAAERLRAIASVLEDATLMEQLDAQHASGPALAAVQPVLDSAAPPPASGLTPREREIVELLGDGARVSSIAARLGLSVYTVRNHLKSIYRKLQVKGQHELYEYWQRRGRPGT